MICISVDKGHTVNPKTMMKKPLDKYECFFIILFSFWSVILPAYLYFSYLDNLDDISFCTSFQNNDQEDSIPSLKAKEGTLLSTVFVQQIITLHSSLAMIPDFVYPLSLSLDSKSPILRC